VVRLVVSMPELRDRVRGDQHGGRGWLRKRCASGSGRRRAGH